MKATRGHYICEVVSRIKKLESGLYLADRMNEDVKDNVARCVDSGGPVYNKKGRMKSVIACEGDYLHYKPYFEKKFRKDRKDYVSLTNEDIIAVERGEELIAPGVLVIVKLMYADKSQSIYIPDKAKQMSGDFWGEVVSVGPECKNKDLKKGDKLIFLRNEGYRFKTYGDRTERLAVKWEWCFGVSHD